MLLSTLAKNLDNSTSDLRFMQAILRVMDAEDVVLPDTGRGTRYDACQYVENLLGKESGVVVSMRQALRAN